MTARPGDNGTVISQRFGQHDRDFDPPPETDGERSVHIHLHVPGRLTEVLVQLLATFTGSPPGFAERSFTGQRSLFPDAGPESEPAKTPPAASEPAEHTAAAQSESAAPDTLLGAYQLQLRGKRSRSASASTIGDHQTSCRQFDEWCELQASDFDQADRSGPGQTSHRFCTPVRRLSEPEVLHKFAAYLVQGVGLSAITVGRRLTHVCMIAKALKIDVDKPRPKEIQRLWHDSHSVRIATPPAATPPAAAPAEPKKSRHGAERLNAAIATSSMASSSDERRIPSFEELDRIARAVSVAAFPYGEHAPYFWRGWIRYLALFGPRSRDVVSTLARKPGLTRGDVIFGTACPIADVSNALGRELHSPHGWLSYVIGKDHVSDCRKILLPMPRWLRDWLTFFLEFSRRPNSQPGDRIFGSSHNGRKSLSQQPMSQAWHAILEAADVDPRLVPSEGTGGRIAVRKFAANWWHMSTLRAKGDASLADKMVHYVLHHREVTTASRHYLNTQAAVLPVMLELLESWPKPAADAPPVSMLPE